MNVLICNAGSTSLKFKLFDMPCEDPLAESKIERVGSSDNAIFHYKNCRNGFSTTLENQSVPDYASGIKLFLSYLLDKTNGVISDIKQLERVGFKTVLAKGYYGTHELTDSVLDGMRAYMPVAPAHNGPYLEAIEQFRSVLPGVMFVGAFETAFHTTIPMERKMYGIPYEWYEKYGIQKMGYHGASHSYVADYVSRARGGDTGKLISCHLGGSGSLCAINSGRSVDNSFGFSLQAGIIHSNRVGDMDSYIIPYLLNEGMSLDDIMYGLGKNGGLLGISGISNDLRYVEDAADRNPRAKLALDVYCNGIIKYIGSYYAELGGLDCIAFTGGIGENSAAVRRKVCKKLLHMGVVLDQKKNDSTTSDGVISAGDSPVTVYVISANEEVVVARKTYDYVK